MLEMFGIPYVGHDPLAATSLDNKHTFKRELTGAGIPTAPFMTWHLSRGPFLPKMNSRFARIFGDYAGSFIVKPVSGRASLHVHVVDDVGDLPEVVDEVFNATDNLVLIETYLPGREFCVSVGGPGDRLDDERSGVNAEDAGEAAVHLRQEWPAREMPGHEGRGRNAGAGQLALEGMLVVQRRRRQRIMADIGHAEHLQHGRRGAGRGV